MMMIAMIAMMRCNVHLSHRTYTNKQSNRQLSTAIMYLLDLLSFVLLPLLVRPTRAFTQQQPIFLSPQYLSLSGLARSPRTTPQFAFTNDQETYAEELKRKAAQMRLEAETMDMKLTLEKIASLERKIAANKVKTDNEEMQRQLEALRRRLNANSGGETKTTQSTEANIQSNAITISRPVSSYQAESVTPSSSAVAYEEMLKECPIAGFDEEDLALYIPVCRRLEEQMPNATDTELMSAFREEESLQTHYQAKIAKMIAEPLEDLQRIEQLRSQYLKSTSRVQKEQLKREMRALERKQQTQMTITDGVFLNLPPLTPERLQERIDAIEALPRTLRAVYMSRTRTSNTTMAIYLDYYDAQLQLLEQVPYVEGIEKIEVRRTVEALPYELQQFIAETGGIADEWTIDQLVEKLMEKDEEVDKPANKWAQVQSGDFSVTVQSGDMADIDYVDRSRYVSELYPALARMPSPSQTEVDAIVQQLSPYFMVRSKPEDVVGGYYLRGDNLISDDDSGLRLSEKLQEVFHNTSMQCFYIQDPSPVSDENLEMGYRYEAVIFVTSGNSSDLYRRAGAGEKLAVVALSGFMVWVFAVAGCEMQPILSERIDQTLNELNSNDADLSWLLEIISPTIGSMLSIYASHELGHKLIAWRDKVSTRQFSHYIQVLVPTDTVGHSL